MNRVDWRIWGAAALLVLLPAMVPAEEPTITLPPANELLPADEPVDVPAPRPRRFVPSSEVEELKSLPSRQEPLVEPGVLEVPADSPDRRTPSRSVTQSRADFRRTPTNRSEIRPVGGLLEEEEMDSPAMDRPAESRQVEQSVVLEWVGPDQLRVGQPFVYELVVRNVGRAVAQDVVVRDQFPASMKVITIEPQGSSEADGYSWSVGSIEPGNEKHIRVEMVPTEKGELTREATVTASSSAPTTMLVTMPKLAVEASMPEKTMIGDPATVAIAVSNTGDGTAEDVVVRVVLSEGLRHEKGSDFTVDIGSLGAGESRNVQLVCGTGVGGKQTAQLAANGSGELHAECAAATMVTQASLTTTLEGPGLRYLDRQAIYTTKVSNTGDAPAEAVKVTVALPVGFKYIACSAGGRFDYSSASVVWTVGSMEPGETKEFSYKCVAVEAGEQKHVASATASRGLKSDAECPTRVEGISALLLEVVDVDDPVEVGADTSYEIRVTNQGSRDATNVEIHALVPAEMVVRGAQGPVRYRVEGQEILFAPLPKLAPRADAIYRVLVTGAGKGDLRFRARLISDSLTEPVIEEESTKVYED